MADNKVSKPEVKHPTLQELMNSTDKSDFEYVKVPAKDNRGYEHPDIVLNHYKFEAGKKHFVHPIIAAQIQNRLEAYKDSVLRTLLSNQDRSALKFFPETS